MKEWEGEKEGGGVFRIQVFHSKTPKTNPSLSCCFRPLPRATQAHSKRIATEQSRTPAAAQQAQFLLIFPHVSTFFRHLQGVSAQWAHFWPRRMIALLVLRPSLHSFVRLVCPAFRFACCVVMPKLRRAGGIRTCEYGFRLILNSSSLISS